MENEFQPVWKVVELLLEQGVSVIPVRDKDEISDTGRKYPAKSPYIKWEQYQRSIVEKQLLFKMMDDHNTTAIATICGEVSGNLEAVDIDVKHKPGIASAIFNDLKNLYPELYSRLRIHKTPSGGYHIIYRIDQNPPGNLKIAGRPATEEELSIKKEKVKYFVETRGEGGYVVSPPSLGYSIVKDAPIPLLTWEERMCIIITCENYHEIVKVEKPYTSTKADIEYYEENPFDDFNNRCDPSATLVEFGYTELKHNNRFIWFTRPGGSKGHIHISFNLEKRFYKNFSSNSELEEKGYSPANLVSILKFGGDKKKLYAYLVSIGYGKVKSKIEAAEVKRKVLAGKQLPANFSEEAKDMAVEMVSTIYNRFPYGIFWEHDDEGKIIISRERLYTVAEELGFRFYENNLYQIVGKFIHSRTERYFFDAIKGYIQDDDGDLYEDICNSYESFIQKNGKFTIERLKLLLDHEIVFDTRDHCDKFFENCYLRITKDNITSQQYDDLTGLVFADRVQPRQYAPHSQSIYIDFLQKSIGISDHLKRTLGFLCHEYKDATMAYIIVLVETCPDPKMGGGSGKNVFCELLKYTTSYIGKPGTGAKFDEKFFQSWNGQRVFAISDIDKNFDFAVLKEAASGSIILKKLYKDETIKDVNKAPKLVVLTNFSYEISDGGLKRRIIPIEFSSFFTLAGGLDIHYNKLFPEDWTSEDWNGYDTFISECVQLWLNSGRKLTKVDLSETGWEKQFEHTFKQVAHEVIKYYWDDWKAVGFVSNDIFKTQLEKFYVENSITINYRPSSSKINTALEVWCSHYEYDFTKDFVKKIEGQPVKGKLFIPAKPPF